MKFDVQNALRDLDERTPTFLVQELFAHGDLTVKRDVVAVLSDLEPEDGGATELRSILSLT